MKVSDIFKDRTSFSFEVFPPKDDKPMEPIYDCLDHLAVFNPDFISCTYGAGGTNKGRNIQVCQAIMDRGMTALTHFTCIGNTEEDVQAHIDEYISMGVENVLAIRGDYPEGWDSTRGAFSHSNDMIEFIKERAPDLCMAAACYIEKHIESPDRQTDLMYMLSKQEKGADFFMTQLCYDVYAYERFIEKARNAGITKPIEVGVMPVLTQDSLIKMSVLNGCSIPSDLALLVAKYGSKPEEFKLAGKEYTAKLMLKYLDAGVDGLHIYTMNRYKDVSDIIKMTGINNRKIEPKEEPKAE